MLNIMRIMFLEETVLLPLLRKLAIGDYPIKP